jgi:hypothetical protein
MRPADDAVIADCRQMLAIVQMPEAKLLRLPNEWDRYREPDGVLPASSRD